MGGETRTSHAFWNLNKCYVGAASFALPWAVSKTGVITAIFGFVLLSGFALLTFRWMLIASHFDPGNPKPTYPELAEIAFSHFFPICASNQNIHRHQETDVEALDGNTEINGFVAMQRMNGNGDHIENELFSAMNGRNEGIYGLYIYIAQSKCFKVT